MTTDANSNTGISIAEAVELLSAEGDEQTELFVRADKLRRAAFGDTVTLCSVINAKSGSCSEDCSFCAQSAKAKTGAKTYPLVEAETMVNAAATAADNSAERYGIVTSGAGLKSEKELGRVADAIRDITGSGKISPCASLGMLDEQRLARLQEAGLTRYHHNLETSESFFRDVCSTHDYADDIATIEASKKLGLSTCCGGIFGLGESNEQRVELLDTLRRLDIDSVPLNFLIPIEGVRLKKPEPLNPFECLRLIAVARLMLPRKEIRVCGGREYNLRDYQSWIFLAGADGMMIGGYLTTPGRAPELDLQMIADAGLKTRAHQ